MRVTPLQRHVALAIAIGLTFWAAVAAVAVSHQHDARRDRATHALSQYRTQVRAIFTHLYDDVQPMEDAVGLVLVPRGSDSFPARDLLLSKLVLTGIDDAKERLTALHPPPTLKAAAADLVGKLGELRIVVESFPPLDRDSEYLGVRFDAARRSMEASLYELSTRLERVLDGRLPPLPSRDGTATEHPRSRGSYIVASAHICGPADHEINNLPEFKEVTDPGALPTIRRTATVMTRVFDQLTTLPRPPSDAGKLKRDVVTPLRQEPSIATALTDLVRTLERHDEAGLADVGDEFDAAVTAAQGAADALESYGALACADLLAYFLDDESDVLSA